MDISDAAEGDGPPVLKGKYPRYAPDFADLGQCIEQFVLPGFAPSKPFVTKKTRIRAQGSCFSQNLAARLQALKYQVSTLEIAEGHNTPAANVWGLKKLAAADGADFAALKLDELTILTLGIAEGSVSENGAALREILDIFRAANPEMRVVLSVSPVPLNRSYLPSAVVADCVSKSTLRVVVAEYMETAPDWVTYWPSFEMVRWLGAHLPPVYGQDDGMHRHVNMELVDTVVRLFLKYYAVPSPA